MAKCILDKPKEADTSTGSMVFQKFAMQTEGMVAGESMRA
jgi:hypothetical protein